MKEGLCDFVDRLRRRPSVAQIGGFRPEDHLKSWFGGGFLSSPGTQWPLLDGEKAVPLLQVKVSELPSVPDPLAGRDLIQVFASAVELPVDLPAPSGQGFCVRELTDTGDLIASPDAPEYSAPRPFQIKWTTGKPEGPIWNEAALHVPDQLIEEHVETDDPFATYNDRYFGHAATKVGGWATYIQGCLASPGTFVLQIASEEKPRWMIGDNGNMYFYVTDDGQWFMNWDCY